MPPIGYKRSRALWDETRRPGSSWRDVVRAILYELQPIRFSKANREKTFLFIRRLFQTVVYWCRSFPGLTVSFLKFLKARPLSQWLATAGVISYYYFVRWIHNVLEAGPIVVIITSLVLIFTVGLGDDSNRDGLSAYSIFNRGFEKLLGAVDEEALLAQHVGGGLGGGAGIRAGDGNDDHDNVRIRPRERRRMNAAEVEEDGDNQNNNDGNNVARKTGKKARRRNLEQRREIQRQREAAAELGDQAFD